jgi:hypothetical protein
MGRWRIEEIRLSPIESSRGDAVSLPLSSVSRLISPSSSMACVTALILPASDERSCASSIWLCR